MTEPKPPPRRSLVVLGCIGVAVAAVAGLLFALHQATRLTETPAPGVTSPSAISGTGTAATATPATTSATPSPNGQATATPTPTPSATPTPPPADDPDGIGDPYAPAQGGRGYDALSYDVTLTIDPVTAWLDGQATVRVTLTAAVPAVHLDLGLTASAVTLNGAPAGFRQTGFDLSVATAGAGVGDTLEIGVAYAGVPSLETSMGNAVQRTAGELLIADEPDGTSTWLPVNGHPRDPATFRGTFSVPTGVEAISVGRLVSHTNAGGRDIWTWATDEPAVPYAIMLAVGQYRLDIREDVWAGGRSVQYVAAASEGSSDPDRDLAWLAQSIDAVDSLSRYAGTYPFSALGGLIAPFEGVWGALETHGRPVYYSTGVTSLLTHELSHQWFGDKVTLYEWNDMVVNEGMATYCEYLASFGDYSQSVDTLFESGAYGLPDWEQQLSNPGADGLFTAKIYQGGGAAIQAVRNRMGDDAFFAFFRAWADQTGPRSLENWRAMAQAYSPVDLTGLLAAWFDGTTQPDVIADNGYPI
jgi:aminopeptidase N